MNTKIGFKAIFLIISIIFISIVVFSPIAHAQYWIDLPPYNTLWPLWSPALSPIDPISGEPVPLVSSLDSTTILPVVPGLTWDPSLPYPWLLYNTASSGLAYYDPFTGINLWPAPSLLDEAGLPAPISLPPDYQALSPIDYGVAAWILTNLAVANNSFLLSPFGLFQAKSGWFLPPATTYLTPLDILGPELAAIPGIFDPVLLTQPAPVPTLPVPTVPILTAPLPTAPIPIAPLPTLPVQTLIAPTAPVPTAPVPVILPPTAPVPTIPVPTTPVATAPITPIPVTAPVPVPPPTVTGVTVVPIATVSGLFLFPF
ncbi:MAG: hypothetical protein ACMUJM_19610 [bacterium]